MIILEETIYQLLDKSEESTEIVKIVEGLTYLLELKFLNAYKILT